MFLISVIQKLLLPSAPLIFSALFMCFGQGPLSESLSRCCYSSELAGSLYLFDLTFVRGKNCYAKMLYNRTLEGHDQPAIAPPQRLRAPSVVVRLDFLWRGDDLVFVFVLLSHFTHFGRGDCSQPSGVAHLVPACSGRGDCVRVYIYVVA